MTHNPRRPAEALTHDPERWIELDDCTLPYWKLGDGPDLVFIHGWPLDARTWRHCVNALASTFTCHLIDLPGAGRSRWTRETKISVERLGEVVAEAVGHMELSGAFGLVGHDSGGTFARLAAAQLGDQVCGMALGNTEVPGHHPWRLKALLPFVGSARFTGVLYKMMNSRMGRRLLFHDSIANTSLIEGDLYKTFVAPMLSDPRALAGAMLLPRHMKAEDFDVLADAHPRITAPVRLIWGEDDPWFPLRACREMVASFGGPVDLVVLKRAKLLVHEDHPQRFAEEVQAHFEACFDARSATQDAAE